MPPSPDSVLGTLTHSRPDRGDGRGMSDFMLDTDVLVRCLRGIPETLELARNLTEEGDLHVSIWSQLEILTIAQLKEEKRTFEFLSPFITHPIIEPIAQRAAVLLRSAATIGQPLGFSEAIIAATAIQHGLTLVTHNSVNLQRLGDLKIHPASVAAIQRGAT
jgi:predicted nucleic acid-binding protein